jgi:hypothetical protein
MLTAFVQRRQTVRNERNGATSIVNESEYIGMHVLPASLPHRLLLAFIVTQSVALASHLKSQASPRPSGWYPNVGFLVKCGEHGG